MNCPECGGKLGVIDSRAVANNSTRRRLKCTNCGERFTSIETIVGDPESAVNTDEIFKKLAKNCIVSSGYTSSLTGGTSDR